MNEPLPLLHLKNFLMLFPFSISFLYLFSPSSYCICLLFICHSPFILILLNQLSLFFVLSPSVCPVKLFHVFLPFLFSLFTSFSQVHLTFFHFPGDFYASLSSPSNQRLSPCLTLQFLYLNFFTFYPFSTIFAFFPQYPSFPSPLISLWVLHQIKSHPLTIQFFLFTVPSFCSFIHFKSHGFPSYIIYSYKQPFQTLAMSLPSTSMLSMYHIQHLF